MFFIAFRCATGARRGREYGKNGELAPWSGGLFFSTKGSYNDPRIALDCFFASLALEAGLQGHYARDDGKSAFRPNEVASLSERSEI